MRPALAAWLIALALGASMFTLGASWSTCLDIGGGHAGVVSAAMNTSGQIGSVLSPLMVTLTLQRETRDLLSPSRADVYPTLAALAGLKPTDDLDGRTFVPVLQNPSARGRDVVFIEPYGKWGMIMDPATRRIRAGTPDHYMTPRWEHREGWVWGFFTAAEKHEFLDRAGTAISVGGATNVTVRDNRITASATAAPRWSGPSILIENSSGVALLNNPVSP